MVGKNINIFQIMLFNYVWKHSLVTCFVGQYRRSKRVRDCIIYTNRSIFHKTEAFYIIFTTCYAITRVLYGLNEEFILHHLCFNIIRWCSMLYWVNRLSQYDQPKCVISYCFSESAHSDMIINQFVINIISLHAAWLTSTAAGVQYWGKN